MTGHPSLPGALALQHAPYLTQDFRRSKTDMPFKARCGFHTQLLFSSPAPRRRTTPRQPDAFASVPNGDSGNITDAPSLLSAPSPKHPLSPTPVSVGANRAFRRPGVLSSSTSPPFPLFVFARWLRDSRLPPCARRPCPTRESSH